MNNGLHEHMAVFVAVANARSLTAASIATGIAQPTISRQLVALEKHLGCRLLHRSTRVISLTEQGEKYLRHAQRLLELNDEAESVLTEGQGRLRGRLRVACSNAFGRKLLMPALADWHAQHPQMQVELVLSDKVTHLIGEQVDVAFRTAPLSESTLVARAIGISRRSVVASRAYLRKHRPVKTLEDLKTLHCILFSGADRPDLWSFTHQSGHVDVRVQGLLTVSTMDALQDAVLADLGVAVMPDWFWSDEQAASRVTHLLPEYRPPEQIIHAITVKRQALGSKVRRFVDHVEQYLRSRGLAEGD
jgi:DNA-binding transcriptional LysR family regulator